MSLTGTLPPPIVQTEQVKTFNRYVFNDTPKDLFDYAYLDRLSDNHMVLSYSVIAPSYADELHYKEEMDIVTSCSYPNYSSVHPDLPAYLNLVTSISKQNNRITYIGEKKYVPCSMMRDKIWCYSIIDGWTSGFHPTCVSTMQKRDEFSSADGCHNYEIKIELWDRTNKEFYKVTIFEGRNCF